MSHQRVVRIPVEDIQSFGNTALFSFDFVPANRNSDSILSGEILCNSTLDLHGLKLWARMPDLELFAKSGFPFTQYADLSQTVVVLPTDSSPEEIALYLHLMSYFGAQTGSPALRVTVTGPSNTIEEGRDYLILGTVADQPAFNSLASLLPATLSEGGVHTKPLPGLSANLTSFKRTATRRWSWLIGKGLKDSFILDEGAHPDAMVEEIESPASADRSIVTIVLRQNSAAGKFAGVLVDPSQSSGMAGSLTLLLDSTFQSFESNYVPYHVGDLSWFATMRLYLTRYFLLLLIVVLCLSFLTARFVYGWMAWHARQRLLLAESPMEEDVSRDLTAP
jgi:cellulose synthase (UDP-forming)